MKKVFLLASTGGSVIDKCLEIPEFKSSISGIVSDRECGAIRFGRKHGVDTFILNAENGREFSNRLLDFSRKNGPDAFISAFYQRILEGKFLEEYAGRVFNIHPSILPAFPGFGGFRQSLDYGVKLMGVTGHLIDPSIDLGSVVIQSYSPRNPSTPEKELRHEQFVQECKILMQMADWIADDRLIVEERMVKVRDGKYAMNGFSPNIDKEHIRNFSLPLPD